LERWKTKDRASGRPPLHPPVIGEKEKGFPIAREDPGDLNRPADAGPELVFKILGPLRNTVGPGIQDGIAVELMRLAVEIACP
jgi:hypothetical protein